MQILLDSNIWRYLVDADAIRLLREATQRAKRSSIVIAPAVLYEAALNEDAKVRGQLLSAMTQRCWKRLMPEAFDEAEELKREIRHLKPLWLRAKPDLNRFRRIRQDWCRAQGGLWDRIQTDSILLRQHEKQAGLLERAQMQARYLREEGRVMPANWLTTPLRSIKGSLPSQHDGWDGSPFEPWRLDGYNVLRVALGTPDHPTYDWLEGEIDLSALFESSAALLHFWLHDVRTESMPRHWLRWGFEFLQRQRKVTDGTPADCQLGTYLAGVDVLATADKIFHDIATKCHQDAPFPIAKSVRLPAGSAAIEPLLDLVRSA